MHVMNMTDVFTFPSGCHVAEVEIDPETGAVALLRYTAVDDYGRLINPLLTEGQVQGGVTQGIGQAMVEHTVYDPASGQLLSGSLMDYALPRADDLPAFDIELIERPTAANPLGVKGSGQAGCIAAPQTVMAAILDALRPAGVEALDMPATPERVWQALRRAALRTRHGHRREVDVPALRMDVALDLARDGIGPHVVDHPDEHRLVDHAGVDPGQHLVEFLRIGRAARLGRRACRIRDR